MHCIILLPPFESYNFHQFSFPPPFITGEQSLSWLLDTLAEDWGIWLPADAQETIKLYV